MMMSRSPRLAAAFAMTLFMGGCATPVGPAPTPETQFETRAIEKAGYEPWSCEPGKEGWRAQGPSKRGGSVILHQAAFEHLDFTAPGRVAYVPQVNNGLFEYRSCFFGDYKPHPRLVKSWEVSPDGRSWTFKLRDDFRWHNKPPVNGRPFTSADVAWTVDHQKAGGLLRSFWQDTEHSTPDPHTFVVRLKEADADWLVKMADHRNLIVAREIKEQYNDFKTVAVGTGAFTLKEFKLNQEVVLDRNPAYQEAGDDGKPLPYLDEVRLPVFSDATAAIAAFRTGQIDHIHGSSVRTHDAEALKRANPKLRMYEELFPAMYTLYFDLRKKPWDDVRVRKAMHLAIDREEIVKSVGGAAYAGFIPPYLLEWAWPQEKVKERSKPDMEAAKKLLVDAGYPPGSIKTTITTAAIYRQEAEIVQQRLASLGIEASVDDVGPNFGSVLQRAAFDLGWGAYPGLAAPNFWVGDFLRTGSNQNFLKISDPRVDELVNSHSKEMDSTKRRQALDQLQERLYELMPYVPAASHYYNHGMSCRLRNAKMTLLGYNAPLVVDAWLDNTGC